MKKNRFILVDSAGKEYELEKFPIIIGNYEQFSDVLCTDPQASAVHATILKGDNDQILIRDEKTNIGTLVNGENIKFSEGFPIKKNDVIQIGNTIFTFIDNSEFLTKEDLESLNALFENIYSDDNSMYIDMIVDFLQNKIDYVNSFRTGNEVQETVILEEIQPTEQVTQNIPVEAPKTVEEVVESRRIEPRSEEIVEAKPDIKSRQITANNDIFTKPSEKLRQAEEELKKQEEAEKAKEIVLKTPGLLGQNITITDLPFTIGKEGADYILDKKGISRIHVVIDRDKESGRAFVQDLSTNGTYVNTIEIGKAPYFIKPGDTLELFNQKFKVLRA